MRAATLSALLLLLCLPGLAQTSAQPALSASTEPFTPNVRPELALQALLQPIKVDGNLDEAAWQASARATNFAETNPGDNTRPPIDIETWTAYDAGHIYFAFRIYDDPKAIRQTLTDRDNIWQDDYVGVILDTYGDNAWSYFLAANPIGIQGDTRIVNGGDEDLGFDVVFQSSGRITDTGYQVEMAVPFRSLRFPSRDVQTWKLNFWITRPRESRNTYSWAAISRDDPCWLCQMGAISGLQGIQPGGKLELLPALTGSQSSTLADAANPRGGLDSGRLSADPSLGLKYSFSPNLIADLTLNPDFSQIEADAAQVDVNTTFALFFPERRPFFQEGSDLFNTTINAVYTRTINNPLTAAKLTGRSGRTSVGYIGARDRDTPFVLPFEEGSGTAQARESVSNILRAKQTFGSSSYVGALITDRRLDDGGSGSVVGLDGTFRLSQKYSLEWQAVGSRTVEPNNPDLYRDERTFGDENHTGTFDGEQFNGYAAYASLERDARHWNFDLDYWATSPTFRADNGFVFQNNWQRVILFQMYTFYRENGFVERIMPDVLAGYDWNFDGQRKDEYLWLGLRTRMKGQTFVGVRTLVVSNEVFEDIDFRGLRRVNAFVESNFSKAVQLGGFVSRGRAIARNLSTPEMGNNLDVELFGTIRPTERLRIEPTFNYSQLHTLDTDEEVFSGYIARARTSYQFTRRLFLRLVTQYNDFSERFDVDPLITYRINPFSAFYLGSTHDVQDFGRQDGTPIGLRQTDRQFFFKFQYLVRV
jgi:hypothetical protein